MVEAVVEFDYQATEEDELNLVKGEIITNVIKMDGGWWEGTLKGKTGMFPDNFVKEIVKKEKNKDLSGSIKRGSATGAGGGHVAELANRLGKEGLKVGAGSVKRQDSKPQGATTENLSAAATAPIPTRVRVAHSYTPKNDDELELIVGQIINISNKEEEGWWEGTTSDGRSGVFPSNFVEEIKDEEDTGDGEFQAIQGKKVKGIGFGNIFAGGPVKLKGAKKQDGSDSTEHAKPAPQEAKRKSHAPPVPSEPQNAVHKEKPVWLPVKSKSCSALEPKVQNDDNLLQQQFCYVAGNASMDHCGATSDEKNDEVERRKMHLKSREDTGDYTRESEKTLREDNMNEMNERPQGPSITNKDSDDDCDPVWLATREVCISKCKMKLEQTGCECVDELDDDDIGHTSVDCMNTSAEYSEDDDETCEVYVPYTKDVTNESNTKQESDTGSTADDSNLTCISDLDQGSFLSNAGNVSSASEVTVPLQLGSLSHARQTPPPKLTFRKRRSIGTPKDSPIAYLKSGVSPPQVDVPPIKKQKVSPTYTHLADREGPLGLIPLDTTTSTTGTSKLLVKHPIDSVPEESIVEESTVSEVSSEVSPNQYFSAVESCTSGGFYTPGDSLTSNTSDETMTTHSVLLTPQYHSTASKKRVSFSPQDHYMAPSGRKSHIRNLWAHSPLKYLRRRNSSITPINSKPLEAEHITDSVKLARQRRVSTGVMHAVHVKHKGIQVAIQPVVKSTRNVGTETEPSLLNKLPSPVKTPVLQPKDSDDMLPQYVPYSIKDRDRVVKKQESFQNAEDKVDNQDLLEDLSKVNGKHGIKPKRRSSFAAAIAFAFTPKKTKSLRKSEIYLPRTDMNEKQEKSRSLPASSATQPFESTVVNDSSKNVKSVDVYAETNANPLNLREYQSNSTFALDQVTIMPKENSDSLFTENATLPRSANASQTCQIPMKFGSSDDVSYFEFMQKRGRISPAIQNIVNKYRISTGGTDSILEEDSLINITGSKDASKAGESRQNEDVQSSLTSDVKTVLSASRHVEPQWIEKLHVSENEVTLKQQLATSQEDKYMITERATGSDVWSDQASSVGLAKEPNDASSSSSDISSSSSDNSSDSSSDDSSNSTSDDSSNSSSDENDVDRNNDTPVSFQEIYDDLKDVQDIIKESLSELPANDKKIQENSDISSFVLDKSPNRFRISPSTYLDAENIPGSESPRRRRKKTFTPPNVGKARRVPIPANENIFAENAHDLHADEMVADIVDAAPQRKSAFVERSKNRISSSLTQSDTVEKDSAVRQNKLSLKRKISHNKSFLDKFKRKKKGSLKNDDKLKENKAEVQKSVQNEKMLKKPHKESLFRRLSLRFRGKRSERVQVTFADVAELCLPDNSDEVFNAQKDLSGAVTPESSIDSRLPEETSTAGSNEIPDKSQENAATEADSMQVLIDKDDQLAMGDLTGNEEDWKILSHMLETGSDKKLSVSKEQSVDSIRDEYIDDELNDTMELTGDRYTGEKTDDEVISPSKVYVHVSEEPYYTSTPTKHAGNLSPSLEVLFSDSMGATDPDAQYSSGDYITRSPAVSSYNSDEVNNLVTDTPEKRLYYNLTNQELSPSIGGSGDAELSTLKSSVPVTPQQVE